MAFVLSHKQIYCICYVKHEEGCALKSGELLACPRGDSKVSGYTEVDKEVDDACGSNGHGLDDSGRSENEKHVENIRSDDITESNIAVALTSRNHRCNKLGKRCSESNYRKTDNSLAKSDLMRNIGRRINRDISADNNYRAAEYCIEKALA